MTDIAIRVENLSKLYPSTGFTLSAVEVLRARLKILSRISEPTSSHAQICIGAFQFWGASILSGSRPPYLTKNHQSKHVLSEVEGDATLRAERSASFDYGLSPSAHAKRALPRLPQT